jgi:hypothetical protein
MTIYCPSCDRYLEQDEIFNQEKDDPRCSICGGHVDIDYDPNYPSVPIWRDEHDERYNL